MDTLQDAQAAAQQKAAVMLAFVEGKPIQARHKKWFATASGWFNVNIPCWDWSDHDYRVKPVDLPVVPWDLIDKCWNAIAKDRNGSVYLYQSLPECDMEAGYWLLGDRRVRQTILALDYTDIPWEESLQVRST